MPVPGSDAPGAASVTEALLARRIVMVGGPLTAEAATTVAAQVMLLDAEDEAPIELHLASPDGDLDAALALADTVALATAPVRAVCSGTVGGPVLAVVAAARRRVAQPHATFRLREPEASFEGRAADVTDEAEALARRLAALHERLAEATGLPVERVAADLREGRVLTAAEARDYGLVHEVAGAT